MVSVGLAQFRNWLKNEMWQHATCQIERSIRGSLSSLLQSSKRRQFTKAVWTLSPLKRMLLLIWNAWFSNSGPRQVLHGTLRALKPKPLDFSPVSGDCPKSIWVERMKINGLLPRLSRRWALHMASELAEKWAFCCRANNTFRSFWILVLPFMLRVPWTSSFNLTSKKGFDALLSKVLGSFEGAIKVNATEK